MTDSTNVLIFQPDERSPQLGVIISICGKFLLRAYLRIEIAYLPYLLSLHVIEAMHTPVSQQNVGVVRIT